MHNPTHSPTFLTVQDMCDVPECPYFSGADTFFAVIAFPICGFLATWLMWG